MDSKAQHSLVATSIVLLAVNAAAELRLPGATMSVQNPPSQRNCVDEHQLANRIHQQLTANADFDQRIAPLQIEIAIVRNWSVLVADLRVLGRGAGSRQIEAARCDGLTDALAVTVAMILDQDAQEQRAVTPATAAPIDPEAVVIQPAMPPAHGANSTEKSPKPPEPPASLQQPASILELRAWLGGGYGSPGSSLFETGLELDWRGWAVQLGGFWQPKRAVSMDPGQLELTTFGGSIAGCRRFGAIWRLGICLRGQVGVEQAHVNYSFFTSDSPALEPVVGLGPSVGFETGSRWVVGLELLEQTAFFHDRFEVTNSRAKYEPSVISLWLVARVALSNRGN